LGDAGAVSIESGMFTSAFAKLKENHNIDRSGKFDFNYANTKDQLGGVVGADMIRFKVTAPDLTASQFTSFVIHLCTASGSSSGSKTGFAVGESTLAAPEPGTLALALLGIGVLGLAKLPHRRHRERVR